MTLSGTIQVLSGSDRRAFSYGRQICGAKRCAGRVSLDGWNTGSGRVCGKVKTSLGIYQIRIHGYVLISMTFHMNVAG